jgi:uncharacterized YigZ family protein
LKVPARDTESETRIEIVIRRSRFIALARGVSSQEEARSTLKEIKARFHDANHVCHAFSVGREPSCLHGCGDDGEPSGTAGRPMLEVLKGSGVGDVLVAVARYFGGVKLGTGGLVQAYSAATEAVLGILPLEEDIPRLRVRLTADYKDLALLERQLVGLEGRVLHVEFGERVCVDVLLPAASLGAMRAWWTDLTRGGTLEILDSSHDSSPSWGRRSTQIKSR